ncbi:MAG: biopolymer transporter ExbD [Candidatus Latescibacteria bacterium]|nr:biopolymer transporter ExbD [Candidatus Latescibacterota bacterium]
MKRRKVRRQLFSEGEIDLTPLIDCIFLLLIFFMVTTVFIQVKGLVVDLPGESDQQEEQQQKKDVNIHISADGEFTVGGSKVAAPALAGAIKGAMEEFNNKNIIIQGDVESKHKDIVYVMDMAYSVGAEGMAFAIEQEAGGVE